MSCSHLTECLLATANHVSSASNVSRLSCICLSHSHANQIQHFPPAVASQQFHASTLPAEVSGGSDGKESACNAGNAGSIPASGKFPGVGNGNPLQYSCLENHR